MTIRPVSRYRTRQARDGLRAAAADPDDFNVSDGDDVAIYHCPTAG